MSSLSSGTISCDTRLWSQLRRGIRGYLSAPKDKVLSRGNSSIPSSVTSRIATRRLIHKRDRDRDAIFGPQIPRAHYFKQAGPGPSSTAVGLGAVILESWIVTDPQLFDSFASRRRLSGSATVCNT